MRYLACFLSLVLCAGCGAAVLTARPGHYSVSGATMTPEAAMATASMNYVNEQNARGYWRAVEQGKAFAYPGGWGSDYELFYGNMAPMPGAAPVPVQSATDQPRGGNDKAQAAYDRATDALKILKRLEAKQRKGGNR